MERLSARIKVQLFYFDGTDSVWGTCEEHLWSQRRKEQLSAFLQCCLIDSGLFEVAQSQHALNLLPAELRKFVDNDGFNQLYYRCCWEKRNSLTSTERNSYTAAS